MSKKDPRAISRRRFLCVAGVGLAAAASWAVGCAPTAAPSPTVAPKAPEAPKPAAATAPAPTTAPAVAPAAKTITLKLSHDEPATMLTQRLLTEMADGIAKKSNGAVKLELFPGAQLSGGNIKTMIQQTQSGAIDVAWIATSIYSNWTTKVDILSLPFLSRNIDDLEKLAKSDLGSDIMALSRETGLTTVDLWTRDLRQWVNQKREIRTPDDIKGLKFRVPETAVWVAAFKAVGATPTPMPFSEAYTAVQLGTLDGAERPTEFIIGEKWAEIAKFLTVSNYTGDVLMVSFNTKVWEGLPKDVQDLLAQEIKATGKKKYEQEREQKIQILSNLEKAGMQVHNLTDSEYEAFRKAMAPVWTEWEPKLPSGWIARAQKILGRS